MGRVDMQSLANILRNQYFILLLRLILGGIFIWASIDKIANPDKFATAVRNYLILPMEVTNLVAIILPWVEMMCGILLIVGFKTKSNALVLTGLLFIFNIALLIALARGLDISCGCFDVDSKSTINGWYVLRDWSLLLAGVILVAFGRQGKRMIA